MKNDSTPKEEKCSLCEGTGVVDYENCPKCKTARPLSSIDSTPKIPRGILGTNCPYGNEDCPTCGKSTPSEGWAERFDRDFIEIVEEIRVKPSIPAIKDFISQEIAKARQDERRECIKAMQDFSFGDFPVTIGKLAAYNYAISKIIKYLEED